jgi:hypothetical protein
MNNVKQYLIILPLFTFLLSGCVANNEMTAVVEHLQQSNSQAQKIIEQLSAKDKEITALANAGGGEVKPLAIAQVQQHYAENLADLRLAIIGANSNINLLFESTKKACFLAIEEELASLEALVKETEQQAEELFKESKKFPDDKVLELQAAKAAADYFGRLNAANSIGENAKNNCDEKLQIEKTKAEEDIKTFQTDQQSKLTQLKKAKIAEVSVITLPIISDNKIHFDALIAWTRENEAAYNNTSMYLKTNNVLSSEGVLASVAKGFGQGAITVVMGKDVVVPSASDIVSSGKALVDGITKNSKAEFAATLLNAKQSLANVKSNIGINLKEIVQSSVMTVLRNKAEKLQ